MTNRNTQCVSNIEALVSSIRSDDQVYRWFTHLTFQSGLQSQLAKDQNITILYDKLKKIIIQQRFLFIGLLTLSLLFIALQLYLWLSVVLIFLYPIYRLNRTKKDCVALISEYALKSEFNATELTTKTLYQICEILSRKYNIPSLVDTIYAQDNLSRKTIIFTFVFTAWIYPLTNILAVFIAVILAYHIIYALTKTTYIYKNLK